jgi:hypothetical protein
VVTYKNTLAGTQPSVRIIEGDVNNNITKDEHQYSEYMRKLFCLLEIKIGSYLIVSAKVIQPISFSKEEEKCP